MKWRNDKDRYILEKGDTFYVVWKDGTAAKYQNKVLKRWLRGGPFWEHFYCDWNVEEAKKECENDYLHC